MDTLTKDLKYYLNLPWTLTLQPVQEDDKKFYKVCVNELPGVCAHGNTYEKAFKNIREALHAAIELYLEMSDPIPEPIKEEDFKGKIAYRTSCHRHWQITQEAQRLGISLSQFIDQAVDKTVSNK